MTFALFIELYTLSMLSVSELLEIAIYMEIVFSPRLLVT